MRIKVYSCREKERADVPVPVPRHFVTSLAVCEETLSVDRERLPAELVDRLLKTGSLIIDDPDYANSVLGLKIDESSYLKIVVEE